MWVKNKQLGKKDSIQATDELQMNLNPKFKRRLILSDYKKSLFSLVFSIKSYPIVHLSSPKYGVKLYGS